MRGRAYSPQYLAWIAEPEETRGLTLTGYILSAVEQGAEGSNCGSKSRTDIHVWLYSGTSVHKEARDKNRSHTVVAEVTLGWLDDLSN